MSGQKEITLSDCITHLMRYRSGLKKIRTELKSAESSAESSKEIYHSCEYLPLSQMAGASPVNASLIIAKYSVDPNFLPEVIFGYHPMRKDEANEYGLSISADDKKISIHGRIRADTEIDKCISLPNLSGNFRNNLDSIIDICKEISSSLREAYPINGEY